MHAFSAWLEEIRDTFHTRYTDDFANVPQSLSKLFEALSKRIESLSPERRSVLGSVSDTSKLKEFCYRAVRQLRQTCSLTIRFETLPCRDRAGIIWIVTSVLGPLIAMSTWQYALPDSDIVWSVPTQEVGVYHEIIKLWDVGISSPTVTYTVEASDGGPAAVTQPSSQGE